MGQQHAGDVCASSACLCPLPQGGVTAVHVSIVEDVQQHAADLRFVRNVCRDDLHHQRITDATGSLHGCTLGGHHFFGGTGNTSQRQQSFGRELVVAHSWHYRQCSRCQSRRGLKCRRIERGAKMHQRADHLDGTRRVFEHRVAKAFEVLAGFGARECGQHQKSVCVLFSDSFKMRQ